MTSDALVARARQTAGLHAFESHTFEPGLNLLIGDLDRSSSLTPQGRTAIEQIYVDLLVNRLKIDAYVRGRPALATAPIRRPVFILGLPRSGTTLVSYLLDVDPRRRSLLKWEIWNSVPPPKTGTLRTDPRCLAMKAEEEAMLYTSVAAMHHEDADGPSECTFVVAQDFRSCFLEALHPVPRYSEWLLECDFSPAYAAHRRVLQVLQSDAPGSWTLKMPSHALYIDALLQAYPDARIIWTHRDPYVVTGSLCSMVSAAQASLGSPDSNGYVAAHYPRQLAEHVRRPMAAERAGHLNSSNCYHLHYRQMMRDPINEMHRIYAWLGDDLTDDVEIAMRSWMAAKPRGKFGKHEYSLEKFGLSVDQLRPLFEDYLACYSVELE